LPSLTISPVSPVSSPSKTLISPDGFGNVNQLTTSHITTPLAKNVRRITMQNSMVDLLHLVDSPFDVNNEVRRSDILLSPSSPLHRHIFLDDPTRPSPVFIDCSVLLKLINNAYLDTSLIDYLIQRSIPTADKDDTIIASSLSLSLMQSYLKKGG
jgi:hypothetical protein